MQYKHFCLWLLSLGLMFLPFLQIIVYINSLILLLMSTLPLSLDVTFFIHSPIGEHLAVTCFDEVIMNT